MLQPGAAVILDYETTSFTGAVCEVAVIAADTGEVLLNTLVDPMAPITPAAHRVHGISADDVAGAPNFPQVLPRLEHACRGRVIVAYHALFDYGRTEFECSRWRLETPIADDDRWDCAMIERSAWLRRRRHLRLGGDHRALGDVRATRRLLHQMALLNPSPDDHRSIGGVDDRASNLGQRAAADSEGFEESARWLATGTGPL